MMTRHEMRPDAIAITTHRIERETGDGVLLIPADSLVRIASDDAAGVFFIAWRGHCVHASEGELRLPVAGEAIEV